MSMDSPEWLSFQNSFTVSGFSYIALRLIVLCINCSTACLLRCLLMPYIKKVRKVPLYKIIDDEEQRRWKFYHHFIYMYWIKSFLIISFRHLTRDFTRIESLRGYTWFEPSLFYEQDRTPCVKATKKERKREKNEREGSGAINQW